MWNKESIQELLAKNSRAVNKAVLAIYARQTADEQAGGDTVHQNAVGFSGCDAKIGSYYAGYIKSHPTTGLTGTHLQRARRMMSKYWRQLAEIANERAGVKPPAVVPVIEAAIAYKEASDGGHW